MRSSADAWIRPRRLAVRACEDDQVAVRVAEPDLAMVRAGRTVGSIAVRHQNDLSLQRLGTVHSCVEVVDLKPECGTVPVWTRRGISDLPVMVLNIKRMELKNELAIVQQALRLTASAPAFATEKLLINATAQLDVVYGDARF